MAKKTDRERASNKSRRAVGKPAAFIASRTARSTRSGKGARKPIAVSEQAGDAAFEGDVQAQCEVKLSHSAGAIRVTIKKAISDKLALAGESLSAAAIEISPGKSVLVMGVPDDVGRLQINKLSDGAFEVVSDETEDLSVDRLTSAFLALKIAQFERGQLELSGPWKPEEWKARFADSIDELQALLEQNVEQ